MLGNIFSSFFIGFLAPLTAVCILPLYPGFITFLLNKIEGKSKKHIFFIGSLVVLGVITFMLLLGLIFTTILQVSLTKIIGIISPLAFILLSIISILLIFNIDFSKFMPQIQAPIKKNPYSSAFIFGFFFGPIIIPCNPLIIAAFFAQALNTSSFYFNLINFLAFGFGIGLPLLVLTIISSQLSNKIIIFLTRNKATINRLSGIIMLGISLYYLLFVFKLFG